MKHLITTLNCILLTVALAANVSAQEPGVIALNDQSTYPATTSSAMSHQQMIDQLQTIIANLKSEERISLQNRLDAVQDRVNQNQLTYTQSSVSDEVFNQEQEVDIIQMTPQPSGNTWQSDSGESFDLSSYPNAQFIGEPTPATHSSDVTTSALSYSWSAQPPQVAAPVHCPGPIETPMVQAAPVVHAAAPVINTVVQPLVVVTPQPIYRVVAVPVPVYAEVMHPVQQRRHHGCLFRH